MIDNYLPMFDIEKQKLREKNIDYNLNKLISDINNNTKKIHLGAAIDSFLTSSTNFFFNMFPIFNSPKTFQLMIIVFFMRTV